MELVERTRVLIVDDHEVVLTGVASALGSRPEMDVVGTARNGREAIQKVDLLQPDVVIMDLSMPDINGVEATRRIKEMSPDIRVVILTMHSDAESIMELLQADISAYILKEDSMADLVSAIQASRNRRLFFSRSSGQLVFNCLNTLNKDKEEEKALSMLSRREREILRLIGDGLYIKEIAERLSISPKTVETHKYNIMDKLGVSRNADLIKIAVRERLSRP